MLRRTAVVWKVDRNFHRGRYESMKYAVRGQKYPALVSYHQLPWMVVAPHSTRFHETVGEHYAAVLDLASKTVVPGLALDAHPEVPADRHLHLLPGTVYVLALDGAATPLEEWAPFGWEGTDVTEDTNKTAFYALSHRDTARVVRVVEFISPDLRLCCNAVAFSRPHTPVASRSTLRGLGDVTETGGRFVVFQFFRPNRAPSELLKPLERFYVHKPDMSALAGLEGNWRPCRSLR